MDQITHYKKLFYETLRIRLIEEAIADRYKEQEMRCPVHLSIGQEAVATGVCHCLEPSDLMMSTHRAHAHYLAKGGSLKAMMAEIYGKKAGCCGGRGGSMHLVDLSKNMIGSTPIVGGSFPVAIGLAFASHLKKENKITVIFLGEAMTEEGVFAEGINFAALKNLPIFFVCETNLYSVYSPMEVRQPPKRDICKIVEAHGISARKGDGNRIDEVLNLSKEAIEAIHAGKGPQFIELSTYRFREHCGPNYDIQLGYRTQEELEYWESKCPIQYFKNKLLSENLITESELLTIEEDIRKEIDEAFDYARQAPYPEKQDLLTHIYAS